MTREALRPAAPIGVTAYGCDALETALFRRLAPRRGVTPTVTDAPVTESNVGLAAGNRCISVSHRVPVANRTLRQLSRAGVTYVSTRSVGCDHIDVEYAARLGVEVGNVAYAPDSVADHTLMLILMVLREAKSTVLRVEQHDYRLSSAPGRELRGLTVGVVGAGRIGAAVVHRLQAFGCRILVHDRRAMTAAHVPLDDLLRRSDVVTLHTPLSDETHHLLDRRRIGQMKPGAIVVNTGRGALVDTAALVDALANGRLGGAALDVVEGEEGVFYVDCRDRPLPDDLVRLQRLPNVVVTPHTAFHTERAARDRVEHSLLNCLIHESGTR
ncbi:NAD(P)-dependent oxidoreductase [Nocardioides sp. SYSU DS0651]|uniref:NAD(P)-dependent oxidoreductase n=1 Tax=Nocardioides sp. SYSU DS0651 TaxID=3415955 RepID=UPI003F4B1E0D